MLRADDEAGWDARSSCSVFYFYANYCTGWLWVWEDFSPSEQIGVVLNPCCASGLPLATQVRFWTGSPSGYGFTGTLAVSPAVNGCPGTPIQSIPYLPVGGSGAIHRWLVGFANRGPVVLSYTLSLTPDDPLVVPSDHPAAGPTGTQACGYCYPSTRVAHSFSWGVGGTLCPGRPFNDDVCDAEFLDWGGLFACWNAVEGTSWGKVKSLYR